MTAVNEGKQLVSGEYLADRTAFSDIHLSREEWEKFSSRKYPLRATSGRFMYKSLSRMRLMNSAVAAERVQNISEQDVLPEGVVVFGSHNDEPGTREDFIKQWNVLNKS